MTSYVSIDTEEDEDNTYSLKELSSVDKASIPEHIAIIMDGNRRWAKNKELPSIAGHWKGVNALMDIVKAASDLGVKVLTVYSFSTENWNRPQGEVDALMELFELSLKQQRETMVKNSVRLCYIGDISRFPTSFQQTLKTTQAATTDSSKIDLVLALNYGGRNEITRAIHKIIDDLDAGKLKKEAFNEELIGKYLDTSEWRDPDLFIRTSGEMRISNFLIWQISYSEVYITKTLWPDFTPKRLLEAILDYQNRNRRLGQ